MRLLMDQLLPLLIMANMNVGGGTRSIQQNKDSRSILSSHIKGALLQYVSSKTGQGHRELIQTINQKCADARKACKKKINNQL